jgi:beta-glucosidase
MSKMTLEFPAMKPIKIFSLVAICIALVLFSCAQNPKTIDRTQPEHVEREVERLLGLLTLEEKISLVHANSKFTVAGVPRLGIAEMVLSDGPHGVREEISRNSWDSANWDTDFATYLPTLTAVAASWDPEVAHLHGTVLGREARHRNKDIILGPGVNLARLPLYGRNFEYFGEDPYLAARLVVPEIRAIQLQDVAACVKHYALNSQELNRTGVNAQPDERTVRELYLPAFEAAVKEGGVYSVMGAYNQVHGTNANQSPLLVKQILKNEWDFDGVLLTDWNVDINTRDAALNGLDLEMGTEKADYNEYFFARPLHEAVQKGEIPPEVLNEKVRRILRLQLRVGMMDPQRLKGARNTAEHRAAAQKIAEQGVVLLKNEDNVLPLQKNTLHKILVMGPNADVAHGRGGGSSQVKSEYEVTPLQGLRAALGSAVEIQYIEESTFDYVPVAAAADAVIYFAGLNHEYDREDRDRPNMMLPGDQDQVIAQLIKANPKTVVIMVAGSAVEMPWAKNTKALLWGWYAGMEAGHAFARVLLGEVNPSGKMPITLPQKLADTAPIALADYNEKTSLYKEGVFIGYRWFEQQNIQPEFPFGHGLSYTRFELSDLRMPARVAANQKEIPLMIKVKNTGLVAGAEVVQIYVQDSQASVPRPLKELKGFQKVFLQPGESRTLTLLLRQRDLAFWDVNSSDWRVESGEFKVLVGASSADIRAAAHFIYE